jgi:hypothetical protein
MVEYNHEAFLVAGYEDGRVAEVESYSVGEDKWSIKMKLPKETSYHSSIVFRNRVLIFGKQV